jgi:predicted amidohydrolase YtcJ
MISTSRWLHGPRFLGLGTDEKPAHALRVSADGSIEGWSERVPAAWSGQVVELPGSVALPGLHDAHLHLDWMGAFDEEVDLGGVGTVAALRARLEAWAVEHPTPALIIGRDLDFEPLRRSGELHWRVLEGSLARPVLIRSRDGHGVWLNREAMGWVPDAWKASDPEGGTIGRDREGAPNGTLYDGAMDPALILANTRDRATLSRRIERALKRCAQAGLTSVHSMALPPEAVDVLESLDRAGRLPVRVFGYLDGTRDESWEMLAAERAPAGRAPAVRARFPGIKLFADGALGSRGAAMIEPYEDEPTCCGHLRYPPEELKELVRRAHARGLQVAIHAIGDQGNRAALDALASLPEVASARHRIEHAQIIEPSDVRRFAELGVVASMQPCHATSDASWVEDRIGALRLRHAYPWATLAQHGVRLAFGTDAPIERLDPGPAMASALARAVVGESMALSAVLHARTAGAAVACRADRWLGRLTVGSSADMTLIESLPTSPAEWEELRVAGRTLDGQGC